MTGAEINEFLKMVPVVLGAPHRCLWSSYDAEADVLYIKKPSHATDSEMTDDDILVRYEGEEVIGLTVLHAKQTMSVPRTVLRNALRAGFTIEEIFNLTKIDRWFLVQIKEIVDFEEQLVTI